MDLNNFRVDKDFDTLWNLHNSGDSYFWLRPLCWKRQRFIVINQVIRLGLIVGQTHTLSIAYVSLESESNRTRYNDCLLCAESALVMRSYAHVQLTIGAWN